MPSNRRKVEYEIKLGDKPWTLLVTCNKVRLALMGSEVHLKISLGDEDTSVYLPPNCWRTVFKGPIPVTANNPKRKR